jgi:hypothetical protein
VLKDLLRRRAVLVETAKKRIFAAVGPNAAFAGICVHSLWMLDLRRTQEVIRENGRG